MTAHLLVFDSGIGGLSVLTELRKALPAARLTYVADDAGFPYGGWPETELTARVVNLVGDLIAVHRPDVVVIACNTASTLVLSPLRGRHKVPFVGTVPAIKPAAEQTHSGLVSVLATPGTIARDYTRTLVDSFAAHCHVTLVGSPRLAPLAEARMRGEPVDEAAIAAEMRPAFAEVDGRRTDTVVLACTHYPFLADLFRKLAPWPVAWIDPAPAIARRAATVAREVSPQDQAAAGWRETNVAILTSGRTWPAALLPKLRELGLQPGSESVQERARTGG